MSKVILQEECMIVDFHQDLHHFFVQPAVEVHSSLQVLLLLVHDPVLVDEALVFVGTARVLDGRTHLKLHVSSFGQRKSFEAVILHQLFIAKVFGLDSEQEFRHSHHLVLVLHELGRSAAP